MLGSLVSCYFVLFFSHLISLGGTMASENFVQPAIPRFDGHYGHWSILMENFLRGIKDRARSIEAKGFEGKELPLPSN
ncbi:hypothetical protein ACOSQ3_011934 [Xanthoceras sorbifolium]